MKTFPKAGLRTTRMLNPVHPGKFMRTEIIDAHNLSVTEAVKVLGVSRPTLSILRIFPATWLRDSKRRSASRWRLS